MTEKNSEKRAYSKLQFTPDEEEKIISFVKNNPELYDPKNPNYKIKAHRDKLWSELGNTLNNKKTG